MEPSGARSLGAGGTSYLDKEWHPTHIQVTVLQARSLRAKGHEGTSNPYCIMQLQEQKFQTAVIYQNLVPEWKEECTFRLPLGISPLVDHNLKLTIMHRAHRGFDKFLGQIVLPIEHLFLDKSKRNNEWFSLRSKPGQKEKARGQIQLSFMFMQILEESVSRINKNPPKSSVLSMIRRRVSLNKTSSSKEDTALKPRMGVKFQKLCSADYKAMGSSVTAANPLKEVGATMIQQALPMVYPLYLSEADPRGGHSASEEHHIGLHKAAPLLKPLPLDASPLPASSLHSQPEHPGSMKHSAPFSDAKKHSKPLREDRTQEVSTASGPKNHSLPPLSHTLPPMHSQERAETMKAHQVRYTRPPADPPKPTAPPAAPAPTFLQRTCSHVRAAFFRVLTCCICGAGESKN